MAERLAAGSSFRRREVEGPKGIPGRPLPINESDCTAPHHSWEGSSFSSTRGIGHCGVNLVRFRGRRSGELVLKQRGESIYERDNRIFTISACRQRRYPLAS